MSLGVELKGVGKSYGGRAVLSGVTCAFAKGRITAVIGPNGSGKTTLMRLIARLEIPDSGELVYTDGQQGLPLMRRMTLVAQRPCLFNTTLFNNVAFGLRARGLPGAEIRGRVMDALSASGLSHLSHANARSLSGGEAQRAALARAYALRPDLVLLDEPAANLDPEGVDQMERLIRKMKDEQGMTALIVTHNMFQARRLADDVCLLYGGELVERGARDEFFGAPKKDLTRKFLAGEVVF